MRPGDRRRDEEAKEAPMPGCRRLETGTTKTTDLTEGSTDGALDVGRSKKGKGVPAGGESSVKGSIE